MTYSFLPLESDSWVGLTGFTLPAASAEPLLSGAGAFAGGLSFCFCAHSANTKKSKTKRTIGIFFDTSFDTLFFNTNLLLGSTVEMPTILYDTGTCTGSCAITDRCAGDH